MIALNEEQTIARVLSAAKLFADEIVVVDTGSTDKTPQICLDYGCKLYSYTWQYDFSAARNFAFDKATGDYMMWLDADDVVTTERAKMIKALVASLDADVVMLPYHMGEKATLSFWRERIVKRSLGLKFKGRVHEAITPCGKVIYADIPIIHDKVKQGDPKRNLHIFELMKKAGEKIEGRDKFYYGSELFYNGLFAKAQAELNDFLASPSGSDGDKGQASLLLSRSVKDENMRRQYLLNGLSHVFSPDLLCELGDSFLRSNEIEKAKNCFLTALVADRNITFVSPQNRGLVPHLRLCYCYWHLGDKAKSKLHNDLAAKIAPDDSRVIYNSSLFT